MNLIELTIDQEEAESKLKEHKETRGSAGKRLRLAYNALADERLKIIDLIETIRHSGSYERHGYYSAVPRLAVCKVGHRCVSVFAWDRDNWGTLTFRSERFRFEKFVIAVLILVGAITSAVLVHPLCLLGLLLLPLMPQVGTIRLHDAACSRSSGDVFDRGVTKGPWIPDRIKGEAKRGDLILFEPRKWSIQAPVVDPALIRPIGAANLYVVIDTWDLTPLEAMLLG